MEAAATVAFLHKDNPDLHIIVLLYLRDGTIQPIITEGAQQHIAPLMLRAAVKREDIPASETTYRAAQEIYRAIKQEPPVDYLLAVTHHRNGSIAHSLPSSSPSGRRLSDALMQTLQAGQ